MTPPIRFINVSQLHKIDVLNQNELNIRIFILYFVFYEMLVAILINSY